MFAIHHVTREAHDIHWRRFQEGGYQAFWGSILLGHVHFVGRFAGWMAYDTDGCYMVEGFRSRTTATQYLLWLNGIWREQVDPFHSYPKRPINYPQDLQKASTQTCV